MSACEVTDRSHYQRALAAQRWICDVVESGIAAFEVEYEEVNDEAMIACLDRISKALTIAEQLNVNNHIVYQIDWPEGLNDDQEVTP